MNCTGTHEHYVTVWQRGFPVTTAAVAWEVIVGMSPGWRSRALHKDVLKLEIHYEQQTLSIADSEDFFPLSLFPIESIEIILCIWSWNSFTIQLRKYSNFYDFCKCFLVRMLKKNLQPNLLVLNFFFQVLTSLRPWIICWIDVGSLKFSVTKFSLLISVILIFLYIYFLLLCVILNTHVD